MSSSLEPEKIASIFNLYTKYRYITYNSIISSDIQIYKFKERLQNYNKIFGEMESKKYIPKEPESIQIVVKEGKDKKVYTQEIPLTQNNDEQKEEKKLEKKEEKEEEFKSNEQEYESWLIKQFTNFDNNIINSLWNLYHKYEVIFSLTRFVIIFS